ncbi:hypothetical protein FBU30_004480 [Linnemannia zychae]|nr:hypothetical protein FBU30_004480 [Linnemannia zychae]
MDNDITELRIHHPQENIESEASETIVAQSDDASESSGEITTLTSENRYAHRFYAKRCENGEVYGEKSPKGPIVIENKEKWSFQATGSVLDHSQSYELGTLLSNSSGKLLRLKLLEQLRFPNDSKSNFHAKISIDFEIDDEDARFLNLHYIEFHNRIPTFDNPIEDFLLMSESNPQKTISVLHSDDLNGNGPSLKACVIDSYAISASGSHITTLSFTKQHAHLDLWDLSATNFDTPKTDSFQQITVPFATMSIRFKGEHSEICSHFVGITGSGTMISLCPYKNKNQLLPLHIFQYSSTNCNNRDPIKPLALMQTKIHPKLQGHFGYGAFHCMDIRNSTEENDRFVAFSGPSIQVFSINSGSLEFQHMISVRLDRKLDETLTFISNIRHHYFVWPGAVDELTFWDLKNGYQKSGINLPDQNPSRLEISLDLNFVMALVSRPEFAQVFVAHNTTQVGIHFPGRGMRILASYLTQGHIIVSTKSYLSDKINQQCLLKVLSLHEDMAEKFTLTVHQDYKLFCFPRSKDLIMGYNRGSMLNLIQHQNVIPVQFNDQSEHSCNLQRLQLNEVSLNTIHQQVFGTGLIAELAYGSYLTNSGYRDILQISVNFNQGPERSHIRLGPNSRVRKFSFIENPPQLLLFTLDGYQLWNLPQTASDNFELAISLLFMFFGKSDEKYFYTWFVTGAEVCMTCRRLNVDHIPYMKDGQSKPLRTSDKFFDGKGLFIPRSSECTLKAISEDPSYSPDVMTGAMQVYLSGSGKLEEAVIRHLKVFIKPDVKIATLILDSLCTNWSIENMDQLGTVMKKLLKHDTITWVPMKHMPKTLNPLATLLKHAETSSDTVDVIKIILDYCNHHAYADDDFDFLNPVFGCLNDLIKQYPDLAFQTLARMAYIESGNREYYLHNHVIAYPPSFKTLIMRQKPQIYELGKDTNPVFHYHPNVNKPDAQNRNTIGFQYWLIRFIFQCVFYTLVLSTTFMQVYNDNENVEKALLIAIIAFGTVFLYLEIGQAFYCYKIYKSHKYNILDLLAFGFPLIASVHQLLLTHGDSSEADTPFMWPMSFSVLIVFLHFLFELRIIKSVGKFITIIQQALIEIKISIIAYSTEYAEKSL